MAGRFDNSGLIFLTDRLSLSELEDEQEGVLALSRAVPLGGGDYAALAVARKGHFSAEQTSLVQGYKFIPLFRSSEYSLKEMSKLAKNVGAEQFLSLSSHEEKPQLYSFSGAKSLEAVHGICALATLPDLRKYAESLRSGNAQATTQDIQTLNISLIRAHLRVPSVTRSLIR